MVRRRSSLPTSVRQKLFEFKDAEKKQPERNKGKTLSVPKPSGSDRQLITDALPIQSMYLQILMIPLHSQAAEDNKINETGQKLERGISQELQGLKVIMVFINAAANVKTAKSMFVLLKDKVNDSSILNAAIAVVSTAWFKGKS
ncbi:hypothetical protein Tco_0958363 [Tanacetum coccineum]